MRRQSTAIAVLALFSTAALGGPQPIDTIWTYQGSLEDSGGPISGQIDVKFTLFGSFPAPPPVIFDGQSGNGSPVTVTDGLFNVELDFGVLELADSRQWLRIEVRNPHDPSDTAAYTTLLPDTPVRPVPLALALRGLRTEVGEPNSPVWNVIGGYQENTVTGEGGIVAGGGNQVQPNAVTGDYGVVAGGEGNTAGFESAVGGGENNSASGSFASIGGGFANNAPGVAAMVPGGVSNTAGGRWSFAGGHSATVRDAATAGTTFGDEGTFIWSGDASNPTTSTGPGQFLIDAPGGVGIGTNEPFVDLHLREKDLNADTLDPGVSTNTDLLIESEIAAITLVGDPAGSSDAFIDLASTDLSGTAATRVDSIWRFLKRSQNASSGRGDLQLTNRVYNPGGNNFVPGVEHTFTDNGRFGIGTLGPLNTTVHIVQPDNAPTTMRLEGGYDGADPSIIFQDDAGTTASVRLNEGNAEALELRTDDTTRMTITQAGDVGVGTDTPTEKLDVDGMIAADGIAFPDGSSLTTAPMLVRLIYLDPGSITANGGTRTESLPFPGAEVGDMVIVSAPYSLQGCAVANTYSGTGLVAIELVNADSSSVDLPGNNWRVMVIKSP